MESTVVLATFLKPFAAFALIYLIASPIKRLVQRKMQGGRLKDVLLFELDRKKATKPRQ